MSLKMPFVHFNYGKSEIMNKLLKESGSAWKLRTGVRGG